MASVLISGAGPIGLTMANELARYGISVRIVDKAAARTDKSKALVLWPRTLELLRNGGYVEPFLKAGNVAHGAQLSDGKNIVARVKMDGIDTDYPYALMIAQSETERVLEETLASRGVKVERSVSMESFSEKSSGGTRGGAAQGRRHERDRSGRLVAGLRRRPFDDAPCPGLHVRGVDPGQRLVPGRYPPQGPRTDGPPAHLLAPRRHPGLLSDHAGPLARHRRPRSRDRQRPSPRSDAGGDPGHGRPSRQSGNHAQRPGVAGRLPHQRAQGQGLRPRPRVPRRRRRAHPQPGRRPGHEHRHAGRLQPRLEAEPGDQGRRQAIPARQLLDRAQRRRRDGVAQCRPHDRGGDRAQSGRSRACATPW